MRPCNVLAIGETALTRRAAEVVLSMLLTHFRFAPGKDNIEWVHAGIYQPTVKGVPKPSMPIQAEVIQKA